MLNVILVDDEPKALKGLAWQINQYFKDVNVLKTFTNPHKAIKYLENNSVDCIFLDVEMPEMNGFSFLENFEELKFKVVFVTAYSKYAIRSIRNQAKDYLLKPVEPAELIDVITKLKEKKQELLSSKEKEIFRRLVISTEGKLTYLTYEDILYCESDGNYCKIYLTNEEILTVSKKIKDIQEELFNTVFCRIHHSYLVNLEKVKEYFRDGYAVLENQIKIPVSRNKRAQFLQKMN